jgi:drug/metabolite transporter (DMT)-like permease
VWGLTFPLVKDALADVAPFEFLAIRFALAGAVVTLAARVGMRSLGRRGLVIGVTAGAALFGGFAFQTVGLQYTTASNTGLITGLYMVITPLLSAVLLRRLPSAWALGGVAIATVGLVLLGMNEGTLQFRYGDALVVVAAVSFAVHIVILGRYAPEVPAASLAAVQMWVMGILSAGTALAVEPLELPRSGTAWTAILVTAVVASAAAFFVQTLAQRYVPPTRVAVILASEAAFAALFGVLLQDEVLTGVGWAGAGLILAGMVAAEAGPGRAVEG